MSDEPQTEFTASSSLLAVVAGITGLISFFFAPASILAVILGHIGLWRISRSRGALRGSGLCIFALVMGYLALALMIYHRSQ